MENVQDQLNEIESLPTFVEELPREEALVRLYELCSRFAAGKLTRCPVQAEKDPDGVPHHFGFGCCAGALSAPRTQAFDVTVSGNLRSVA